MGSPDFKQALLERFHGENQINQDTWAKLRYDRFTVFNRCQINNDLGNMPYGLTPNSETVCNRAQAG